MKGVYKENFYAIRAILINDWDPIGVSDVDQAQDEYDSYIPGILKIISSGGGVSELSAHLLAIERNEMGLPGNYLRAESSSVKIIDLLSPEKL